MKIGFTLNGDAVEADVAPDAMLIEVLRARGLTGTKEGCSVGVCGACTVALDGRPVSSCSYFAALADGKSVLTVEGVAAVDPALVDAFVEHEAMQCGICTPGQVMAAYTLARSVESPSEDVVREWMSGNLCRCTGYVTITDAVRAYLEENRR